MTNPCQFCGGWDFHYRTCKNIPAMINKPCSTAALPQEVSPQEPSLHQSANELLQVVAELETRIASLDYRLFAPGSVEFYNTPIDKPAVEPDLAMKVATARTKVACLCGHVSTMQYKLTGEA